MNSYRVLINGANFLIAFDGKRRGIGFYVTRFVGADDEAAAGMSAIGSLKNDHRLEEITLN